MCRPHTTETDAGATRCGAVGGTEARPIQLATAHRSLLLVRRLPDSSRVLYMPTVRRAAALLGEFGFACACLMCTADDRPHRDEGFDALCCVRCHQSALRASEADAMAIGALRIGPAAASQCSACGAWPDAPHRLRGAHGEVGERLSAMERMVTSSDPHARRELLPTVLDTLKRFGALLHPRSIAAFSLHSLLVRSQQCQTCTAERHMHARFSSGVLAAPFRCARLWR